MYHDQSYALYEWKKKNALLAFKFICMKTGPRNLRLFSAVISVVERSEAVGITFGKDG